MYLVFRIIRNHDEKIARQTSYVAFGNKHVRRPAAAAEIPRLSFGARLAGGLGREVPEGLLVRNRYGRVFRLADNGARSFGH